MSLSAKQIGMILSEIGEPLRGGVIQKIDQPQPWGVSLEIHSEAAPRKRLSLYFSADRRHSRLHLLGGKYSNPPAPPQFAQLLRAHLRWKRILSIEQIEEDRVVRITCAWSDKAEDRTITLVAELMGGGSNLFLIDHFGLIRGALLPISAGRKLAVGDPYVPPKPAPTATFREETILPVDVSLFPFNESVETHYRLIEETEEREARRRALFSKIDGAVRRLAKKLSAIEAGLAEAQSAERHRLEGELLKGRLREMRTGMKAFTLFDPSASEEIVISLDPALSPSENLERIFKRYKKAQASRSALEERRKETERELKGLQAQRALLETAPLKELGVDPAAPSKGKKEKKKGAPSFLSADGLTLIVGRNDKENEEVTFRTARGNDLWFHARGVPGSHLIVRMERRKEIPYQTLLDAATLALHFSNGRKETKGDIVYTFRKYVQRSKGGKPGQVICSQEKNLFIEIEPGRLARLFENKITSDE